MGCCKGHDIVGETIEFFLTGNTSVTHKGKIKTATSKGLTVLECQMPGEGMGKGKKRETFLIQPNQVIKFL